MGSSTALVTGATSGVGRATALRLAERGWRVGLTSRREGMLDELAASVRAMGGECAWSAADLGREADVIRAFEDVERALGPIDALVHCAGRGLNRDLVDIDIDEWRATIDANYTSFFLCARQAARSMVPRGGGRLVLVSSLAGRFNMPGFSAYCSSKHAATSLAVSIRRELRRHGLRVSITHPYRIDTPFFDGYDQEPNRSRMLQPDHIARLLVAMTEGATLRVAGIRAANLGRRTWRTLRSVVPASRFSAAQKRC
ncbi:MAG: SDR family oxidoreductase [Gemmatimonadota bacterium]